MNTTRLVVISLLCRFAVAASGDWPMVNGGTHRTSWADDEWSLQPPFDETFSYATGGEMLAVKGETLYIGRPTTPNTVVAVDLETGAEFWTFEIDSSGGSIGSVPAVSDQYVFCGGQHGVGLFAVDRFTGEEVWRQEIGSLFCSNPIPDGDRVFVAHGDLYCFDAETGATLWTFPGVGWSAPVVDDSCIYVTSGQLYALDKTTGAVKWAVPSNGGCGSLGLDQGMLFLQEDQSIVAREKSNGELIWSYELQNGSFPSFSEGILAVSGDVLCFDVWTDEDQHGRLVALEARSGAYLWHAQLDTTGIYTPTIANGVVYAAEWIPRSLTGFDLESGDVLFTDASGGYYAQPIVAAHSLLVPGFSAVRRFWNSSAIPECGEGRLHVLTLAAHPNPCGNAAAISFFNPFEGPAELSVSDISGRRVLGLGLNDVSHGGHSVSIPTLDLPAGIYALRLNIGGSVASQRLVVLR